jgi:Restriction endonuclease
LDENNKSYKYIAQQTGRDAGNAAGALAQAHLPAVLAEVDRANKLREFAEHYKALSTTAENPQQRGIDFEELWRDVMTFYGWHPEKSRVSGEDNDFTAIYDDVHILAEVRWHKGPMDGGKMREFLAKLDPRPRTVGLFISQSGYDNGARDVVRRSVSSKTVVLFSRADIEAVLLEGRDPGPIFREKFRDVADRLFEETS